MKMNNNVGDIFEISKYSKVDIKSLTTLKKTFWNF